MNTQPKVVPDGALFDRVGEFAFGDREWVSSLLHHDPGYSKAVADVVQTLAVSAKIVTGDNRIAPRTTELLVQSLTAVNRLEKSQFFAEVESKSRMETGHKWAARHWNQICDELRNGSLPVQEAMGGHLRREIYYYWLKKDPKWSPQWYSPEDATLPLPEGVLRNLLAAVIPAVRQHGLDITDERLRRWIGQNVTTHFRIFGEYLLFLGEETGHEYMPAHTRGCLRFLTKNNEDDELSTAVLPFIGLTAIRKARNRRDLVPRVVEWSEMEGREIVEGFTEMRRIYACLGNGRAKNREIERVESVLNAKYSRKELTTLNLLKIGGDLLKLRFDEVAKTALELRPSRSYRWLWRLRSPNVYLEWEHKLKELLQ